MKKIRKAFTLIEMVIVLFIISLLLLIMIPNLAAQRDNASARSDDAFKTTIKTQAELYVDNHDGKDTDLTLDKLEEEHYISNSQHNRASKFGKNKEALDPVKLIKEDANEVSAK